MVSDHVYWKSILLFASLFWFLASVAFSGIAQSGEFIDEGLFESTDMNFTKAFDTGFTPKGYTFYVWFLIYVWQTAWLLYGLAGICRGTAEGLMYCHPVPGLIPPEVLVFFIISQVLSIGWIFVNDREYLVLSACLLNLVTLSLYMCLWFACKNSAFLRQDLIYLGKARDNWLSRIFLHNGLGLYAAWASVASILSDSIAIVYEGNNGKHVTAIVCLSALAAELVIWFCLDVFVFDNYTRFLFTPYLVVTWAVGGSFMKNFSREDPGIIGYFLATLLAMAGCLAVVKATVSLIRQRRNPLEHYPTKSTTKSFYHIDNFGAYL